MATAFLNYNDFPVYANYTALGAAVTTFLANGAYAEITGLGVFQLNKVSTATPDNATIIAALNGGNWLINYNVHIMENATSVIDGSQIASFASLSLAAGSAAAPSLNFSGNTNTGIYQASSNVIGFSANGAMTATLGATAFVLNTGVQSSFPSGTVAAPSISFTGDLDTGIYRIGANNFGVACNGAITCDFKTTGINLASAMVLSVATVQVVGARNTGWTTSSGTGTKNQSAINVDTITATDANLRLVGQWLKGVTDALITHGLIGA